MELVIEKHGTVGVVTPMGKHLDASNVKAFKQGTKPVLDDYTRVVLNLRHLEFIDSSGIGAILSFLRALNASGGDLKLCELSNPVRTIFELVRMHRIVEIYNNQEEAVRTFDAVAETV